MKAGNITGYWPTSADDTARTYGYRPVSECEAAIAAGTAGPCHSGESGLVDYGIAEWGDDDIVSINGKRTLSGYVFLLEDAVFDCPGLHLWKSDASAQQGADTTVDGVCGLEIDPSETRVIPYRSIRSMHEDAHGRNLILTLDDGTDYLIALAPMPATFPFLSSRAKRRHQRALDLMRLINEHR